MPKTPTRLPHIPKSADRETMESITVTRTALEELFEHAHSHDYRETAPGENDGEVGDIVFVDDGSTTKIYAKFRSGWKSATFS